MITNIPRPRSLRQVKRIKDCRYGEGRMVFSQVRSSRKCDVQWRLITPVSVISPALCQHSLGSSCFLYTIPLRPSNQHAGRHHCPWFRDAMMLQGLWYFAQSPNLHRPQNALSACGIGLHKLHKTLPRSRPACSPRPRKSLFPDCVL